MGFFIEQEKGCLPRSLKKNEIGSYPPANRSRIKLSSLRIMLYWVLIMHIPCQKQMEFDLKSNFFFLT